MGRPRLIRERNAKGKLRPVKKQEEDNEGVRAKRKQIFGVTDRQSKNALSCCLAGVLYLRGQITHDDLMRFFSFTQMAPDLVPRGISFFERVDGSGANFSHAMRFGGNAYRILIKVLGREKMNILHALAEDRLICPVFVLRSVLSKVPLTTIGFEYKLCVTPGGQGLNDARSRR
jgi:hypothetical protein